MHSLHLVHKPAIAIVGGESLLGKDIRELLEQSDLKAEVKLIASDADEGSIIAAGPDEPLVMAPLLFADLGTAQVVVLAGSQESSLLAYEQVRNVSPAPVVIDLTGALGDLPDARLRAPMVEPAGRQAEGAIQVIAHPAAIALALFLIQLHRAGAIRCAVAEVFEPASERGQAGLDELQRQTVGLLSFKPLSKEVYDAQVSFNMLSQYGSDSPHALEAIELKIDRHLASLLAAAGVAPMPSLRLVQAPVFHGYSISVWVEFEKNPGKEAIVRALASNLIDLRANDEEPPTNVGVAGQSGITVGSITPDRNQPQACWFWMVADNFRIAAENALEVIRGSLA
jgi:aspartate-semialdehyde dehydrogenase